MLKGHRTWLFENTPTILSTGITGGPFEAKGKIADDFDMLFDDTLLKQASFEAAQQKLLEKANDIAIQKSNLQKENINFFISGDLINQITPTNFSAHTLGIPYFGLFSACATSMQGLALSSFLVNNGGADYILTGCASHNSAAERQFRYPTEYGGQKPPTAQWTVTGAGCALISTHGSGPKVTSATIGKIIDLSMTDPFNMGGAMAPAAVDTIMAHLRERQVDPSFYDLIITGDLGKIGRETSLNLLQEKNIPIKNAQYVDCGLSIYKVDQPILSGGSGPACSAIGAYGHFLNRMLKGEIKRMLVVATGSLHSPLTVQQKQSIPCIAHAVSIEMGDD